MMGTCQMGPCPTLPLVGPVQFCAADTECTAPAKCGPLSIPGIGPVPGGLMSCGTASADGGTEASSSSSSSGGASDSGSETSTTTDSGSGGDAAADAPAE